VKFTTAEFLNYRPNLTSGNQDRAAVAFRAQQAVVVIDPEMRDLLFADRDPQGQIVTIAGRKFTVVGVRRNDGPFFDGVVWAPIRYYQDLKDRSRKDSRALFYREEVQVGGQPHDARQYTEALLQLRAALLPLLPEPYRKGIEFNGEMPMSLREWLAQDTAAVARGAAGALAVLLVALIGLANMLLVSVHEEMREVGLQRAVGAQRADILLHFLSRGVLLSAIGAGAGLGVAALVCWATRNWAGLPISVSVFWAGLGALATVIAGTVVSLIPSLAAARVHPVEALRYE